MDAPTRIKLYLPAGKRGLAFLGCEGEEELVEIPRRHADLLFVLWEARADDATTGSHFPGWRTREELASKYRRRSGTAARIEADTITRYGTALLKLVAAHPALGLTPPGGPLLIERRRALGLRLGEGIELELDAREPEVEE